MICEKKGLVSTNKAHPSWIQQTIVDKLYRRFKNEVKVNMIS
jgi:hypothetical protein